MTKTYHVEVPLPGNPSPLVLARCLTPEAAAELVRVLCEYAEVESVTVRIHVEIGQPPPF